MDFFEDERRSDYEYQIGYRKPPRHARFKQGQSGNPRGKPRGTKHSATLLKQTLLAPVFVKQNGHPIKTTKLKVIVSQLVRKAMQGDYGSIRLLFKYAGLDRRLNEPLHEKRGLSGEAVAAIRRAIADDSDEPEMQAASNTETDGSRPSACSEKKPRARSISQRRHYLIGYGRPPTATRFQTGRSGNPFGRPRAPKTFRKLTEQLLDDEVVLNENGQRRVLTRLAVILTQIVNKAAMGNQKFQALLLEFAPALDIKLGRRRPLKGAALEKYFISVLAEEPREPAAT